VPDWVHFDVMDGISSLPSRWAAHGRALRRYAKLPFDVHLMIENPERSIEAFRECGCDDAFGPRGGDPAHPPGAGEYSQGWSAGRRLPQPR